MRRRIFISHSSKNADVAELLVRFFKDTFVFQSNAEIFCSSIPGHELAAGDSEEEALRTILEEVGVVVGLLSRESIASTPVLMELGAAWALRKEMVPLLYGVSFDAIPSWVERHAVQLKRSSLVPKTFVSRIESMARAIAKNTQLDLKGGGAVTQAALDLLEGLKKSPDVHLEKPSPSRPASELGRVVRKARAWLPELREEARNQNGTVFASPDEIQIYNSLLREIQSAGGMTSAQPLSERASGFGGTFGLTGTKYSTLASKLALILADIE